MVTKKTVQVAIRYSDDMMALAKQLVGARKAASFPDYLRGLIYLDACEADPELVLGLDVPGWLSADKRYRRCHARVKKPV